MTAIRPRQPPEQQRREEARAHAKADRVLVSQPLLPLLLAVFYIALLVVPWALECTIAKQPSFIVHLDQDYRSRYQVQHGWLIAINVLNALAAVLSLPILSALLARAAVVFAQRRKPGQTLTLRQLFALADRDWYNFLKVLSPAGSSALLRLGSLVLLIAVALPLARSGLVAYDNLPVTSNFPNEYRRWSYNIFGRTPSPLAVKTPDTGDQARVISDTRTSLQTTLGGIEPNLWPVCNDDTSGSTCGFRYGPYDLAQSTLANFWEWPDQYGYDSGFETNGSALMHASTLRAGSSVGSYYGNRFGTYTLGLKSGTSCEPSSARQVEEQCLRSVDSGALPIAARGWNTSFAIQGELQLDICYPPLETDPWEAADASPWRPINFTEHLYVGLRDEESAWACPSFSEACGNLGTADGLYLHCQVNSVMSFFEIGSDRTKGAPSRFLEEMPAGFDVPGSSRRSKRSSEHDPTTVHTGPLKTATMAMFGNDSWLDTLNLAMADVEAENTTVNAALAMVCQVRPLGNIDTFANGATCEETEYRASYESWYTPRRRLSFLVRDMFKSFRTRKLARATLNTATFYANKALLSRMNTGSGSYIQDSKSASEESDERMAVPVLSMAAIATVSVLVALQVVCILVLLAYIYSSRVWTLTLDSLAMARVGAQLSALDVFLAPRETGTLGTARLNPRSAKQLDQVDGLVGSTTLTGELDVEMAAMPPPYAPRGEEPSTREERRVLQPGAAGPLRDTDAQYHPVPSYSPLAGEHTAPLDRVEAGATSGRRDVSGLAVSHATSSESSDSHRAVLAGMTSPAAVAVGGRGPIARRMWRQANKPLPARPTEQ